MSSSTSNREYGSWFSNSQVLGGANMRVPSKNHTSSATRRTGGNRIRLPESRDLRDIRTKSTPSGSSFLSFQLPNTNGTPALSKTDRFREPLHSRGKLTQSAHTHAHGGYSGGPSVRRDSWKTNGGRQIRTTDLVGPPMSASASNRVPMSLDMTDLMEPTSPGKNPSPKAASSSRRTFSGAKSMGGTYGNLMFAVKENQDNYFIREQLTPPATGSGDHKRDFLVGVMDGHGMKGKEVSTFVKKHLPAEVLKSQSDGVEEAFRRAYRITHDELSKRSGIDCSESGSTAVTALRRGDELYVANVGDSRCVLGRDEGGVLRCTPLTRDHKPDREDERQRIIRAGGGVEPVRAFNGQYMGPHRVWAKKQLAGGLAMSRAIGDTNMHNYGVTSEPEVVRHRVGGNDRFIVLGSDGVFDHLSNDQVMEIVARNPDPKKASDVIVQQARKQWQRVNGPGGYVDDITAVVMKL
eukprot:Rmarinus@m.13799